MTSDPGKTEPAPALAVLLGVAYIRTIRYAVKYRVLPPRWALRLTAPFYR